MCYSDASCTGCASSILEFQNTIRNGMWNVEEAGKNSSCRELKVIALNLKYFCIKGHTDNQHVSRIVEIVNMKEDSPPFSLCACLRWYGTLEHGDFHEKFNFLKIQDLRPFNTCQKHFEMILPNFPLDECEI